MKGRRPPFRNRDTQIRRAVQASVARKKRLHRAQTAEHIAPPGDAPDPIVAPPVEITDETSAPSIIRPGFRQYQAPTLQQPSQPWLDQSDTPLPLRLSEEQGPSTVTGGESPPIPPPTDKATTPGPSPTPDTTPAGVVLTAVGDLKMGAAGVVSPGGIVFGGAGNLTAGATALSARGMSSPTSASVSSPANRRRIVVDTPVGLDAAEPSPAARHEVEPDKREKAARGPARPRTKQTVRARTRQGAITNRAGVIQHTKILIIALQEALDYDPVRDHNQRPPILWSGDPSYLKDVKDLVLELRRLNSLLEAQRPRKKEAERAVIDLARHFDKFLHAYASWFGKGTALLTVVVIANLLQHAGLDPTAVCSAMKLPHV
jgi:hypothetical protein